jgi:hypothetical protein
LNQGSCRGPVEEEVKVRIEPPPNALSACFEPAQVDFMFETFMLWNIAKRSYSNDWGEVWFNWVDRRSIS